MSRGAIQKLQRRNKYEKQTKVVFCNSSKKGSESRSSRFEPKISLISFSRGLGLPFKKECPQTCDMNCGGCLRARRFRHGITAPLVCVRSFCNWRASCVDPKPKKTKKNKQVWQTTIYTPEPSDQWPLPPPHTTAHLPPNHTLPPHNRTLLPFTQDLNAHAHAQPFSLALYRGLHSINQVSLWSYVLCFLAELQMKTMAPKKIILYKYFHHKSFQVILCFVLLLYGFFVTKSNSRHLSDRRKCFLCFHFLRGLLFGWFPSGEPGKKGDSLLWALHLENTQKEDPPWAENLRGFVRSNQGSCLSVRVDRVWKFVTTNMRLDWSVRNQTKNKFCTAQNSKLQI